eukprot:CAMPEP_0202691538 /NCGR_PEP_ID=MMETSP1385-20130828/6228_1 /ASSEMBLY_ACC=CAM_ASM_000861 /TAXON_ID=933848 /ORGANISM="Elphidium margaritaceum" /LENGTH=500 /DNA_ID=CAMNT_0049346965 /DNA_START=27 /DNA_END=1525 /DNA_ORIENTATION=+
MSVTIGVLALQGDFTENIQVLQRLNDRSADKFKILDVRDRDSLSACDGLIIPGGESTSIGVVARDYGLIDALQSYVASGKPVWGICAGLILLSAKLTNSTTVSTTAANMQQPLIGGLSVLTHRNYFGHQNKSALRTIYIQHRNLQRTCTLSNNSHSSQKRLIESMSHFIRAPAIMKILDTSSVKELAFIYNDDDEKITCAVEQGSVLATAFHPEVTGNDAFWHQYFIGKVYTSLNRAYNVDALVSPIAMSTALQMTSPLYGLWSVKTAMPRMLQGGVIMDVVNAQQARIAEEAGACAVMALERIPADIKSDGGVARMSDPKLIREILQSVSIPVMAKSRIGHFGESKILQSLGVDCIDESEVLTAADEQYHIHKHPFGVPFVCGARDLGEALRRIAEGAAMIRLKGNAGTGNVMEAVRHARLTFDAIRKLQSMSDDEVYDYAKQIRAPVELVKITKQLRRLPVVTFAAGGIATPADVMLMMELGCDGVFVGSGIFKSGNP